MKPNPNAGQFRVRGLKSRLGKALQREVCSASEVLSSFFTDDSRNDPADAIATNLDLDTVRDADILRARKEMLRVTQESLRDQGLPEVIEVWRCGRIGQDHRGSGDVTSVTLNRVIAERGCRAGYYGAGPERSEVRRYLVDRDKVLADVDALMYSELLEEELLVRPSDLREAMTPNPTTEPPRGLPYPGWRLYHATSACSTIIEQGFLTRAERAAATGRTEHFAGGGTAHAVSMTLDVRVAESIVIGLKVISRLVKGEMLLGDLLIAGAKQAPTGTEDVISTWKLTPERVLLYDEDLRPFYTRPSLREEGNSVGGLRGRAEIVSAFDPHPDRHYGTEVDTVPEGAGHLKAFIAADRKELHNQPPERGAVSISGWAPKMAVVVASRYGDPENVANNGLYVEMYKRMLGMSSGGLEAGEVYDPLFFLTSLDAMRQIDEDELCVIEAHCGAEWLCISSLDATRLGVLPEGVRLGADFGRGCESRLEDIAKGYERPATVYGGKREWEQPDPSDTVVYLGRAMAEVRVFDSSLLTDLRRYKTLEDIEYEIDPDFDEPGHEIVAYPWFSARGN